MARADATLHLRKLGEGLRVVRWSNCVASNAGGLSASALGDARMHRSFFQLTGLALPHTVVDIGAAETLQEPRYAPLIATDAGRLIGFEPDKQQYAYLLSKHRARTTYVPVAVGDGKRHTLNICSEPGLTSLLEPNQDVLKFFHEFPAWGVIKERIELDTVRLDDVHETMGVTFLQMDIQAPS